MATLIDIGFAKGGTWTVGDATGAFPAEKPKVPQIASRSATRFQLNNAQGKSLSVTTPDYAFQQLTDHREWNWAIYHWHFVVPFMSACCNASASKPTSSARARGRSRDWR